MFSFRLCPDWVLDIACFISAQIDRQTAENPEVQAVKCRLRQRRFTNNGAFTNV
jgi:hypothetical protein